MLTPLKGLITLTETVLLLFYNDNKIKVVYKTK